MESPALPRKRLKELLMLFRKLIRFCVSTTMGAGDSPLFKPNLCHHQRLGNHGYMGHMAGICFRVYMNWELEILVVRALLGLRRRLTRAEEIDVLHEEYQVKPSKANFKGMPKWRHMILALTQPQHLHHRTVAAILDYSTRSVESRSQPPTRSLLLDCPACGKPKEVAHMQLVNHSKWCSLLCSSCHTVRVARSWLCRCGISWHTCAEHAKQGYNCRAKPLKGKAQKALAASHYTLSMYRKHLLHKHKPWGKFGRTDTTELILPIMDIAAPDGAGAPLHASSSAGAGRGEVGTSGSLDEINMSSSSRGEIKVVRGIGETCRRQHQAIVTTAEEADNIIQLARREDIGKEPIKRLGPSQAQAVVKRRKQNTGQGTKRHRLEKYPHLSAHAPVPFDHLVHKMPKLAAKFGRYNNDNG